MRSFINTAPISRSEANGLMKQMDIDAKCLGGGRCTMLQVQYISI